MNEEQLNKEYITDKLQGICQDCMYLNILVPKILDIVKEAYKSGLVQAEIDNTMGVIEENSDLKSRINKATQYILNNKLYCFKYDNEELFEITTDKIAKDALLKILRGDSNER